MEKEVKFTINGKEISFSIDVSREKLREKEIRSKNLDSCNSSPDETEIVLKIDGFLKEYGVFFPRNVFDDMQKALWDGYNNFVVSIKDYDTMIENRRIYTEFNERLNKTAENNNKGIEFERLGNIDDAISIYEDNIKIGYPATHSYDRLLVIYRRLKLFEDEVRIIDLYIKMITERDIKRKSTSGNKWFGIPESSELLKLRKRKLAVISKIDKRG